MSERELSLPDLDASQSLGQKLAVKLEAGEAILLTGDLGAGKTTLARAIIIAMTGETDIPSPTYTLVQSYEDSQGRLVLHADLYRLEDGSELEELGLDEAFETAIVLVEWPDRLGAVQPENRLEIVLMAQSDGTRLARMIGHGSWEPKLAHV